MSLSRITAAAIGALALLSACGPTAPGTPGASGSTTQPAGSGAPVRPQGLLVEVRSASHPEYDRVVFEFGGNAAPVATIRYVKEVHADPSDRVIPLQGTAFLEVAFAGGTLDTSPREPDVSKAQRYTGPTQITPNLPLIKEVTVAGDFEGTLLFGVGLARPAGYHVSMLTAPARVAIDFWYTPASAPPSVPS